jgi:hypothetical protein
MLNDTKDVTQAVKNLTATFNVAINKLPRAFRGKTTGPNEAYLLEREFAYLLHEVMVGPKVLVGTNITKCNEFIEKVVADLSMKENTPET